MLEERLYSIHELSDILKVGKATINVWRIWFDKWLNASGSGIHAEYPEKDIESFTFISQCSSMEYNVEEIKESLGERTRQLKNKKRHLKSESVLDKSLLHDELGPLLKDLIEKQDKLATAEEKKASAMEKRADAELLKAEALNKIASAIMQSGLTGNMAAIAQESIQISENHTNNQLDYEKEYTNKEETYTKPDSKFSDTKKKDESIIITDTDDLSHLINSIQNEQPEHIDDLSDLLEDSNVNNKEYDLKDNEPEGYDDVHDLSTLLDTTDDIDDLASLLPDQEDINIIDQFDSYGSEAKDIDRLSLLLDNEDQHQNNIDDLSQLVENEIHDVDDLSLLVDTNSSEKKEINIPEQKVDPLKHDENKPFDEYKSAVLSRIIILKEKENFSAEETCDYFNKQKIKTLTESDSWDIKTMSDVYNYVDSIRKNRQA